MPSIRQFLLSVALAVSTLLVTTGQPGEAGFRLPVHTMPTRARAGAPHRGDSAPITFHGGAVMTGAVRVHVVWYGGWSTSSRRRRIITDFLQHLASPYWNINRTYPSAGRKLVTATPQLGVQFDDGGSQGMVRLTDEQIQRIVARAVTAGSLPRDSHGIYLVLTSSSVTKVGFLTEYCGWHSYAHIGGSILKFAFVGDPTGPRLGGCGRSTGTPNGDAGADSMVSTIAHELAETVTDPTFRGWRTDRGEENADRCAWEFGPTFATSKGAANLRLGTRSYLVQTNWVNNATPRCAMTP